MSQFNKLPKVQDAEKESQYGYVHAVSGPGKLHWAIARYTYCTTVFTCCHVTCSGYFVISFAAEQQCRCRCGKKTTVSTKVFNIYTQCCFESNMPNEIPKYLLTTNIIDHMMTCKHCLHSLSFDLFSFVSLALPWPLDNLKTRVHIFVCGMHN